MANTEIVAVHTPAKQDTSLAVNNYGVVPNLTERDVQDAQLIFDTLKKYVSQNLIRGTDYGTIPGCGNKPVLLKAGAEKLNRLFKLTTTFDIVEKIIDFKDKIFYYHYRCSLYRRELLLGQCDGIAHSQESKFTRAVLTCPACGAENTLMKSKYGNGYYCNPKAGGCGGKDLEPSGPSGKAFDMNQLNTLAKMAQKRAMVGATLIVCGASEYFTQDLEDMK